MDPSPVSLVAFQKEETRKQEAMRGHREKTAVCTPRREASEAKAADTWMAGVQPPEL